MAGHPPRDRQDAPVRALIAGLDPELLTDDADPINRRSVRGAMDDAVAALAREGVAADLCLLPGPGPGAVRALEAALAGTDYDVVMIGAGVRLDPGLSPLLEQLVEVVAGRTPRPRLGFNADPADMAGAVLRWARPRGGGTEGH